MPKTRRKRIASRGSVNNIILEALNEDDKYGYEIIKQVEEKTNGEIKLKQPSLYSSLSRLEQKGFISSYWGGSDIGGRRHYYYITKLGRHYYNTAILKLEVQQSEEEIDAIEAAAQIKRDQLMNECNTTKVIEEDNTVYVPRTEKHTSPPTQNYTNSDMIETSPYINNYTSASQDNNITIEDSKIAQNHLDSINSNNTISNDISDDSLNNDDIRKDKEYLHYLELIRNSNHKFSTHSKVLKLHSNTPTKKKQVIIKDQNGIIKLRDEDDDSHNIYKQSKPRVIDNVIIRRNINVLEFDTVKPKTTTPEQNKDFSYLSQQEKEERNRMFSSKFDEITNKIIQEREREKENSDTSYREQLEKLSNNYNNTNYDDEVENKTSYENSEDFEETYIPRYENVTLEDGEDPFSDDYMLDEESTENQYELSDDEFINFDEDDSFVNNNTTTQIFDNKPQIKGYKEFRASTTQQTNMNFIRINKARFLFGFIIMLLMVIEVSATFFVLKTTNNYYEKDLFVYIIAYTIIAIISLYLIIPYLFNQDKKVLQNFKFRYSAVFGLLTFLILAILIYAFNSLAGFDMQNLSYFASTIFVPLVLATNFATYPLIYNLIIKINSLY